MIQLWMAMLLAAGQERVLESVVPGFASDPGCSSRVEIANSSGRPAEVALEAHRPEGGLVFVGGRGNPLVLPPGGRSSYNLENGAWVRVRERIPSTEQGPVVAARGITECADGDRLRTVTRDPVFPLRNPWIEGEAMPAGVILLINASEAPVSVAGCYSAGNYYSLPGAGRGPPVFEPVCSETFEQQVPPFGSREFSVEHNGNRWFGLRTRGRSIVLQMLKPVEAGVRIFVVDSTIRFGSEITSR